MYNIKQSKNSSATVIKSTKYMMVVMLIVLISLLAGGCMEPTKSDNTIIILTDADNIEIYRCVECDLPLSKCVCGEPFVCEIDCGCDKENFYPDFSGRLVIVGLTKEIGKPNKVHDKVFFGDIGLVSIIDLTEVQDVEKANLEYFTQILLLRLDINCKKNVLRVVEYLNQIEGISYAEPNHYWQALR